MLAESRVICMQVHIILNAKNLAPPTFFKFFHKLRFCFEILKLILTFVYNSLYFKVCPSNVSFVVLSLQLKLEKPFFAHVQSILIVN